MKTYLIMVPSYILHEKMVHAELHLMVSTPKFFIYDTERGTKNKRVYQCLYSVI